MKKEEFLNIKINDILYSEKHGLIRRAVSQLSDPENPPSEDKQIIWTRLVNDHLDKDLGRDIPASEMKDWEIYRGFEFVTSPKVRELILMEEIVSLKQIVYSHLQAPQQIYHLI